MKRTKSIRYCIDGSCYKKAKWVMGRVDLCDEHRTQYNQWEDDRRKLKKGNRVK